MPVVDFMVRSFWVSEPRDTQKKAPELVGAHGKAIRLPLPVHAPLSYDGNN
jgi:hypothetical protein